jgi:hypothetical protein
VQLEHRDGCVQRRRKPSPGGLRRTRSSPVAFVDDEGTIEIGFAVVQSQWNRGYATAAVAALVTKAREALEVRRIVAHTPLQRPRTGRVLEKVGLAMVREMETRSPRFRVEPRAVPHHVPPGGPSEGGAMKRIMRIEVRFDDGRERDRGPSRETKQAVMAAKAAAKAAADAVIRSFPGMKVTETSSSSMIDEPSDDCRNPLVGDEEEEQRWSEEEG